MKMLFIVAFAMMLGACSQSHLNTSAKNQAKILDIKKNKFITLEKLINTLNSGDIILLGEEHDEYAHHEATAKILKKLTSLSRQKNQALNISLEMLSQDTQAQIDAALKTRSQIKNIKPAIGWSERFDHEGYEAVLHSFFYDTNTLNAAGLSMDQILELYIEPKELSGKYSNTQKLKELLRSNISKHHAKNEQTINKLVNIQQHKDRLMAQTLLKHDGLNILLAGKYHVYKNIGVPQHLRDLAPNRKIKVLSFEDLQTAQKLSLNEADFVWIIQ